MSEGKDRYDIFLRGKRVILKVLSEDDVLNSNWYGWFNDEGITRYMQQHYFPNTREAQIDFYRKEILGNRQKLQLGICDIKGGPIVGVVSINNIDHLNQKGEFSILIGDAGYRKPHYVIEVANLMFRHAFESLNLQRIYGGSIHEELVEFFCRMLGCRKEGVLRKDVFKHGRFWDVHLYGILREEYEARQDARARPVTSEGRT